ncbi:MAG: hypothetical protein DHS20C14_12830 [Phycisphaeraceae bacterium]|nr:MAG: hypothetical protein DHS20C14_12830 [Phycisphaeraceae bacterium]
MSRSFTSSSDDGGRPPGRSEAGEIAAAERALDAAPWRLPASLLVAVALLLGFEAFIRTIPADRLAFGGVGARGDVAHGYFRYLLDKPPVPDVAFVGSSRMRDDIICSAVERVCADELGRPIRVQNYGWPTATNADLDMITEAIFRAGSPDVLIVGLEPRTFTVRPRPPDQYMPYPTPERWRRLLEDGFANDPARRAFTNGLAEEASRAFAFRGRFTTAGFNAAAYATDGDWHLAMRELTLPKHELPLTGGLAWNHVRMPHDSLAKTPKHPEQLTRYIEYQFVGEDPYIVTQEERAPVYALIERCRAAGVPVVFLDMPAPDVLRAAWPVGTAARYADEIRAIEAAGVAVHTPEQLGLTLGDEHFREQSHLNLAGATLYSERVAERVIVPRLDRSK